MHELILGGQKSGKSRAAEARARAWLGAAPAREALLVATAVAGDAQMLERIARHRADRALRMPAMGVVEAPHDLAGALRAHAAPHRLLLVDCLTLWVTQCLMPPSGPGMDDEAWQAAQQALLDALDAAAGPVVLVSNEIGLGVSPLAQEARDAVDALGLLHQRVALKCDRVTLMVAGLEVRVKG